MKRRSNASDPTFMQQISCLWLLVLGLQISQPLLEAAVL